MPNQLFIPFKRTYSLGIKEAARTYLLTHNDTHPDAFTWDINRWETLRKAAAIETVHLDQIPVLVRYHAQLVSILTKLPTDIQLGIAYAPVFSPSAFPIMLHNLAYERAAVLFNLAALYSQLAASEDRSHHEGIKHAWQYYQSAAGVLSFLRSSALPTLVLAPGEEDRPIDLTEHFVQSLEWLMLAQAQECVWQRAVMGSYKNGLIAKLAMRSATLYRSSLTLIRNASPPIKHAFPSNWLPHVETKQYHFEAGAQYRKSIDELEGHLYGLEIARLSQAQVHAKKGYDIARRSSVAPPVLQDIKNLLENVQKNVTRAERDNDLIYHEDVPAPSALLPIQEQGMADTVIHPGLTDPANILGDEQMLFGELLGWGAREAINIYNHSKDTLIKDKIVDVAQELDDKVSWLLNSINLPSALEALERPIGLPPSLLKKADEVRSEQGPSKIEVSIDGVQTLARQVADMLDEAMDILDNEASEDEAARKEIPVHHRPSHEANKEFIEKERRYRAILDQAAVSDEVVRQKWDEWEINIVELTLDEESLMASVPSSTVSVSGAKPNNAHTQTHSRALRVLLESLDDLRRSRAQFVERARQLATADDIQPRMAKAASGFERWVEVQPAMLEDVSDAELAKYDKFIQEIAEGGQKQEEILMNIQSRNELFLQSRRDDPSVKDREHALQSLDLAYHKYREITRNLEEGLQFYNQLAEIFTQFRETCKTWRQARQQEIHSLSHSLQSMSLHDEEKQMPTERLPPSGNLTAGKQGKKSTGLPSLNSDEWETMELPPGPPMKSHGPSKKTKRGV